jgi:hypothetical protein
MQQAAVLHGPLTPPEFHRMIKQRNYRPLLAAKENPAPKVAHPNSSRPSSS